MEGQDRPPAAVSPSAAGHECASHLAVPPRQTRPVGQVWVHVQGTPQELTTQVHLHLATFQPPFPGVGQPCFDEPAQPPDGAGLRPRSGWNPVLLSTRGQFSIEYGSLGFDLQQDDSRELTRGGLAKEDPSSLPSCGRTGD